LTDSENTIPPDPNRTRAPQQDKDPVPAPGLPAQIGRYRPLRIIGQGGMGVVYEAQQQDLQRRVALKVIRPELATDELRRRFAHESTFLGHLQHPGIARIYEAGTADTEDGPTPFIAMELVSGRPLNRWVQKRKPDRKTRIELMIHLCQAVQHAHQRGLIHRDLKSGNILVDKLDRPHILDFGVARPAEADLGTSMLTTHGELIGTLATMSPEQLVGDPNDLDTRSDVYALGVILYELLADEPPLNLQDRPLEEALRAIREEDPPPLADHDHSLAGDLSVIASVAMAKNREERYASANGLAMDLQRHLDDQPIAARPPGTIYLLRKFARRHRPLVAGIAGVAAALVLGVTISTWQAVRATRAEGLAEARLDQAEAVTGFLQDMLEAIQPDEARGRDVTVHEVLDRAAEDLDDGALDTKPEVELALRQTLGNTYRSLGQLEVSEMNLRRGLNLAEAEHDPTSSVTQRLTLDLAITLTHKGEMVEAEELANTVLVDLEPSSPLIPDVLTILSDVRYTEGQWQAADSLQQRIQGMILAETEVDSLELAEIYLSRAFLTQQQNELALADSFTTLAAGIISREEGDQAPRMIKVLNKRGDIASTAGRFADAVAFHEEALVIATAVYDTTHPLQADVYWRLGKSRLAAGDVDGAEAAQLKALDIRRRALGPVHRDIALALTSLGRVEQQGGRLDLAETRFREALAMRDTLFGPDHPTIVASLEDLGYLARLRQQPAQAESLYVLAGAMIGRLPETTGSQASRNAFNTAMSLQDQGRHTDAEVQFRRAYDLTLERHDPPHDYLARAIANIGTCLYRQGRKDEAADLFVEALDMHRALDSRGHGMLTSLGNTAFLLDDAGRYAEAESLHHEYIAMAGETFAPEHPQQADARIRFFDNLAGQEKWQEAEDQARAVLEWRVTYLPEDDIKRVTGTVFLAEALLGQGKVAEADSVLTAAEVSLGQFDEIPAKATTRSQRVRQELDDLAVAR